ncbi:hypothetical protein AB0L44_37745 [Nonomuraea wenchangensis]|uniref:hypothetical protein n=1 Tax=Nonomuraea wenchangensis TaxID=568860 RepID=UPI003435D4D9
MTRSRSLVPTPRGAGLLRLLCWAQTVFSALSLIQPFLGVDAVDNVLWRPVSPIGVVSLALALGFGLTARFVVSDRRWARVTASMAGLLYALLLGSTVRTSMPAAATAALVTLMLLLSTDMRSSVRR